MKLLKEVTEQVKVKVLTEAEGSSGKKYFIEGIFIQGGIPNRNNREYPLEVLRKEIDRYTLEHINQNRAYGELGHPDTPTIQLDRVSHMIRSLTEDGKNFIGKAEILATPNGNIVKALIDAGATLGVSSRGVGSLKTEGAINIVQDDFRLMTAADIVADPSAPDAFVSGIMEGKEWVWEGGILREKLAESTKSRINTLVDERKLQEHKVKLFQDFLSNL